MCLFKYLARDLAQTSGALTGIRPAMLYNNCAQSNGCQNFTPEHVGARELRSSLRSRDSGRYFVY